MTGQAHWFVGVVIILGGLLVVGGIYLLGVRHAIKRVKKLLICPVHGESVACTFLKDTWTDRFVDVVRCSAFADPRAVRCDKVCRALVNPPPA